MKNFRIPQINQLLKTKINEILVKDIDIPANVFITISKIETSPDLRYAKVFISVFPDNKKGTALKILRKNTAKIQKYIGQTTKIKFTPKLRFLIDSKIVAINEIDEILSKIQRNNNK